MTVLIVDDSEILVDRLKSSLAEVRGLEVVGQAETVSKATLEIGKAKPDVVVLDIGMPGGSGIDVLESLKKHPFPPIVIMLTNHVDRQYRKKCLNNGASFYFDKSTEFHRVAEVLQNLMETMAA